MSRELDARVAETCDMCGRESKNLSWEPSRSQLIFGGFPARMERRCKVCERKVAKHIEKLAALERENDAQRHS